MISLTPVASSKVKEIMQMQSPVPTALRVAVVGGGCSGFQYHMAFENQTNESDEVLDFDGLKVAVDQMSSMYLDGVEIDYIETLEGAGSGVRNRAADAAAGGAESAHYGGRRFGRGAGDPGIASSRRALRGETSGESADD